MAPKRATQTAADAAPTTAVPEGTELCTAETTAPGGSVSQHPNTTIFMAPKRATQTAADATPTTAVPEGTELCTAETTAPGGSASRQDSGTDDSKDKRNSSNKVKEGLENRVDVDTRVNAGEDQERPPIIDIVPRMIVSYDHEAHMQNGEHSTVSVAVIDVPTDSSIPINPGDDGFPIGNNLHMVSALNGLGFGIGLDFHKVFNPYSREISEAVVGVPPIIDLLDMKVTVGYDGSRRRYKFLCLIEVEDRGTHVLVFTVGDDGDTWRPKMTVPWHLRTDEWIHSPGAYISIGDSSVVNLLGFTVDPEYKDKILSFNFETEEVMYISLPHEDYRSQPLLCALGNRLCCSYEESHSLSIFQLVDNIWGVLRVVRMPILTPASHHRILPIHFHNNICVVAYLFGLNNQPVGDANESQCFVLDSDCNAVHTINAPGTIHWLHAKPFVESLEVLPY